MWFAEALFGKENGKIITIDHDKNKIERAKRNFDESGLSDLIEIRHSDALKVLSQIKVEPNFTEYFDFVFIDADKERYNQCFDTILPIVNLEELLAQIIFYFLNDFKNLQCHMLNT